MNTVLFLAGILDYAECRRVMGAAIVRGWVKAGPPPMQPNEVHNYLISIDRNPDEE